MKMMNILRLLSKMNYRLTIPTGDWQRVCKLFKIRFKLVSHIKSFQSKIHNLKTFLLDCSKITSDNCLSTRYPIDMYFLIWISNLDLSTIEYMLMQY